MSSLAEKLAPSRAALIVVDMCNDFLSPEGKTVTRSGRPIAAAQAVIPRIGRLLDAARASGVEVCFVQHTTLRDGASDSRPWLEARARATYSVPDLCLDGSWGQEIVPELAPRAGEHIVKKVRYSGFTSGELDTLLRGRRRDTVVCCGVSTNVCVEATARHAFELDYYVVLADDACASWDRTLHEASLATARHRYAEVATVDEITAAWMQVSELSPASKA